MVSNGEQIYIEPLLKAFAKFSKGLAGVTDELHRDGVIQRFEFTYELAWKTLKRVLALKGIEANSPRDVFREAARQNLIDDPLVWFDFIQKRNLMSHVYNEECAIEIFESLPMFEREMHKLIEVLKHYEK